MLYGPAPTRNEPNCVPSLAAALKCCAFCLPASMPPFQYANLPSSFTQAHQHCIQGPERVCQPHELQLAQEEAHRRLGQRPVTHPLGWATPPVPSTPEGSAADRSFQAASLQGPQPRAATAVKATFSANPHGSMFGGAVGGGANPFGRLLTRLGLGAQEHAAEVRCADDQQIMRLQPRA